MTNGTSTVYQLCNNMYVTPASKWSSGWYSSNSLDYPIFAEDSIVDGGDSRPLDDNVNLLFFLPQRFISRQMLSGRKRFKAIRLPFVLLIIMLYFVYFLRLTLKFFVKMI